MFKILCSSFILFLAFGSINTQQCATPQISAIVATAVTPFNVDLSVNVDIIPQYAKYLSENGILDVMICGYIGECGSMSMCERKALIQAWVAIGLELNIGILVQIGLGPFDEVLELAAFCVGLNIKAIVILPEVIYKPRTVEEAVADIRLIAEVAVGIPILLENINAVDSVVNFEDIYLSVVADVDLSCVVGVIVYIDVALNLRAVTSIADKLICVIGHESVTPALADGLNVTVTVAANLFPALLLDIKLAIEAGDLALAEALQDELNLKIAAIVNLDGGALDIRSRAFITNHKVALSLIADLDIALTRLPILPALAGLVNQIADALEGLSMPLLRTVDNVLSWLL